MVPFYAQWLIEVSPLRALLNQNNIDCGSELERGIRAFRNCVLLTLRWGCLQQRHQST